MILVCGATGTVGRVLVRSLRDRGAAVRALVRSPARAADLAELGAELVEGDLTTPSSLDAAVRGVERVFVLSPPTLDHAGLERELVAAAARAGVAHAVRLSVRHADFGAVYTLAHRRAEEQIETSGMSWTHLRPSPFFQNLLEIQKLLRAGLFWFAGGAGETAWIDVRDVARVASLVLTTAGHEGKTYELTGPEAFDYKEMAARLTKHGGRRVRYVRALNPVAPLLLRLEKRPWALARALVELYTKVLVGGPGSTVTDEVERLTGAPPRSFDDFARDDLAALLRPAG